MDEQQVLLPVVVETEMRRFREADAARSDNGRKRGRVDRIARDIDLVGRPTRDVAAHAIDGMRRDTAAETQARDQLAVVHYTPAESALGHARALAIRRNLGKQLFVAGATNALGHERHSGRIFHGNPRYGGH
jgi:hypothetical protein